MNSTLQASTRIHLFQGLLLATMMFHQSFQPIEAAVTTIRWYRMGENNPGSVHEGLVDQGTDQMLTPALQAIADPLYSGDVAFMAAYRTLSGLSLDLNGGSQALWQLESVSTPPTNFGLECWVKPRILPDGFTIVAYNGDTRANGWGFYQNGNTFGVSIGGVDRLGSTTATVDQWVHLAYVSEEGQSKFYVDGVLVDERPIIPIEPQGGFAIGAHPQLPIGEHFFGGIDEVRLFTFHPGEFEPTDLLVAQPAMTLATDLVSYDRARLNGRAFLAESAGAVAWFEYGMGNSFNLETVPEALPVALGSYALSASIQGLNPNTLYYCRLVSSNASGVFRGTEISFRTSAAVTSLANDGPGSLRDAIQSAAPADTIYVTVDGSIQLMDPALEITRDLKILGINPTNQVLDGGHSVRIFTVRPGAKLTLQNLTLQNGQAPHGIRLPNPIGLGSPTGGEGGGAILNQGNLQLLHCVLKDNRAGNGAGYSGYSFLGNDGAPGGPGGAVYNEGEMLVDQCLFLRNSAGTGGQGADRVSNGSVAVTSYAGGPGEAGGGLFNAGSAVVRNSSLVDNRGGPGGPGGAGGSVFSGVRAGPAGDGGDGAGLLNIGTLDLIQCTLTYNSSSGQGGALANRGETSLLSLIACTVVSNSVSFPSTGAAIDNRSIINPIRVRSCLIGENVSGGSSPDLFGSFTSGGFNLVSVVTPTSSGLIDGSYADQLGNEAHRLALNLGPLISFSEVCQGHVPSLSSPALEAGDSSLLTRPFELMVDQAGYSRFIGRSIDAGAIERGGTIPVASALLEDPILLSEADPTTGSRSVLLRGLIIPGGPECRVFFEWGINPKSLASLANTLNPSGFLSVEATQRVSGLVPGVSYSYAIGFSNGLGVVRSSLGTFSIPPSQIPGDTDMDGVISGAEFVAFVQRYWSNPGWLRMTNAIGLGGTNVTFELPGILASPFAVESTVDFNTWNPVGPALPRFGFVDTNAPTNQQRFYRLRSQF